jgi:hypothetical protein
MKYNDRMINRFFVKGKNILTDIKRSSTELGAGHLVRDGVDNSARMLAIIEQLQGLTPVHYKGTTQRARYEIRFNRELESALTELWKMYESIQNYIEGGLFSDEAQQGMSEFTPHLEDHLVRSRNEAPPCGTYYRTKEARKQPVSDGPLESVHGWECATDGPRAETRDEYKRNSKVDEINGGRSVMAFGSGMSYPEGTQFESYTVRLLGNSPWLMAGGGTHPLSRISKSTDPNYLASLKVGMHVKIIPAPKVSDSGIDHTVRVAIK